MLRGLLKRMFVVPSAWCFFLLIVFTSSGAASSDAGNECPQSREESYFSFSQARFHFNQGDFARAEELLREAAILDSCSVSLYTEASLMLLKMGKESGAEEFSTFALRLDPDDLDALKVQAMIKAGKALSVKNGGLIDEAVQICSRVIEKDARDSRMRFVLVKLLVEKGDFEAGGTRLKEFIAIAPEDLDVLFLAAEVVSRAEQLGKGETIADALVEGDLLGASFIAKIGDLLEGEKKREAAHLMYQSYLKSHTNDDILLRDANILYQMERFEEALLALEERQHLVTEHPGLLSMLARTQGRIGKMQDAIASYEKLIRISPENDQILLELADLFEYMGDTKKAIRYYEEAFTSIEDAEDTMDRKLSILWKIALLLIQEGKSDRAQDVLVSSQQYEGKQKILYYILLSRALEADKPRAALRAIKRGRNILGDHVQFAYREAEIAAARGSRKTEKNLREIIIREDYSKESYLRASRILVREGRYDEAWGFLEEALERSPDSEVYLEAGACMERWGRYQDAVQYLKRSIDLDSSNATALNYLGYMLALRGERLEEALAYVTEALTIDRYNGAYIDSLGYIYLKMEQYDLARQHLMVAAEIFPFDPEIQDHIGDLLYLSGDVPGAIDAWKKAVMYNIETREHVTRKISNAESEIEIDGR